MWLVYVILWYLSGLVLAYTTDRLVVRSKYLTDVTGTTRSGILLLGWCGIVIVLPFLAYLCQHIWYSNFQDSKLQHWLDEPVNKKK